MSRITLLRIFFGAALVISSSPTANAGFLSPGSNPYFAAAAWKLTTNGGDGSGIITADAMTLISNNNGEFQKYVRYSIKIPTNTRSLSFSYQWSSADVDPSPAVDQPSYIIGSTQTYICEPMSRSCTTGRVINLDLRSQVGQQFIFEQASADGALGRATLVISDIKGVITAPESELRQTTNLSFDQSQHGSDTLSDPDGQLRKTLDSINSKYGNLISIK